MPSSTPQQKMLPGERRQHMRVRIPYVVLLLFMAFFAYKFLEKTQQVRRLTAQENAIRQQNAQTRADNARMERTIRQSQSPAYIEGEARGLGYMKPGDTPIQSTPIRQPVVAVRAAPAHPTMPPQPSWKLWWQSFFG